MSFSKSATCVGRVSGKPLTAYSSRSAAEDGAAYACAKFGNNMTPYQCARCGEWHLAPASRQTRGEPCDYCVGRDREPKIAYETHDDAERRAEILAQERGVWLKVYECPNGGGWHLTKG